MTTNAATTATDTTNVIPMMRTGTTLVAAPEKGAIHVLSGENGENEQSGTDSEVIRGQFGQELINDLTELMLEMDRKQAATNGLCKALLKVVLCLPENAIRMRNSIKEAGNGNYKKYAVGIEAMLQCFDAGSTVQVTGLYEQVAKVNESLSKTFLMEKIKPLLEGNNILVKKDDNSFRWATLEELQKLAKTPIDLQLEGDHLQLTGNSPAIESNTPANGLQRMCKRLAINPVAKVRHWQRERAMQAALADPWKRVTASGAVEVIHNPYDPKSTGPRTEKEKELIRKAAIAEAEAKLKFKIAAAADKQQMQEIQRASLDADAKAQAIINEGKIKLAQMQYERLMRRERLATYKPALLLAGLAAAVLFVIANNNWAGMGDNNYPVELANMPLPAVGNGE